MFNHYKHGTEAHSIMQDCISAHRELESATETVADQFDNACSLVDDMEDERDRLADELKTAEERVEQHEAVTKQEVKEHVREILLRFQDIITNLEVLYELTDESPGISTGDRGDDSSQGTADTISVSGTPQGSDGYPIG